MLSPDEQPQQITGVNYRNYNQKSVTLNLFFSASLIFRSYSTILLLVADFSLLCYCCFLGIFSYFDNLHILTVLKSLSLQFKLYLEDYCSIQFFVKTNTCTCMYMYNYMYRYLSTTYILLREKKFHKIKCTPA